MTESPITKHGFDLEARTLEFAKRRKIFSSIAGKSMKSV